MLNVPPASIKLKGISKSQTEANLPAGIAGMAVMFVPRGTWHEGSTPSVSIAQDGI